MKNINCIHASNPGGYCKHKGIKRSLFGLGARCCVKYWDSSVKCQYHQSYRRPNPPSPRPSLKMFPGYGQALADINKKWPEKEPPIPILLATRLMYDYLKEWYENE